MANPKGNPQNLQPVRTKEEAKKRGAAGGKKSGASRRKKRDARQAIRYVLDMASSMRSWRGSDLMKKIAPT